MTDEREKFLKKLEHLGEEDVRQKHEKNHFGPADSKRSSWTQEWLKGKEKDVQEKTTREKEINEMETRDIASSSANAETDEDAQPEAAGFSQSELDRRRKKAVKTVIMVGLVSLLIFFYMLFSNT